MQITLKSGAQVTVDVDEFKVGRNALAQIVSLSWSTPNGFSSKLNYINLDEIAAIVTLMKKDDSDDAATN